MVLAVAMATQASLKELLIDHDDKLIAVSASEMFSEPFHCMHDAFSETVSNP